MGLTTSFVAKTSLEDEESARGVRAPGFYRCILDEVKENDKIAGAVDFFYRVVMGDYKGSIIRDTVHDPNHAKKDTSVDGLQKRIRILAGRLGLWDGKPGEAVEVCWPDAVGREVVIKAVEDKYKGTDGVERTSYKPEFAGVYPLDHHEIPEAVRAPLNLPPAKPKDKTPAGGKASGTQQQAGTSAAASSRPAPAASGSGVNWGKL